jgi:asparagine synthase (glutamine-hydrolysing)
VGLATASTLSDEDTVVRAVEELLRDSVRMRMMADVPIGTFLSGGIDSSLVVAIAQSVTSSRVRTFTIGFDSPGFNEAEHARRVAAHLGTDHTELYVTAAESLDVVPRLSAIYDEPFSDSSQIPTFLISQLARREVTVALSGDGGDELFGGYNRYRVAPAVWKRISWMPLPFRQAVERALCAMPDSVWRRLQRTDTAPSLLAADRLGETVRKFAAVIGAADEPEVYRRLVTQAGASHLVLRRDGNLPFDGEERPWHAAPDFASRMMLQDAQTYLPDDILVKVDRASMAVSLECRTPFLDHRLIELAFALPQQFKIRGHQGKWILRTLLGRYVPEALTERQKIGFAVPLAEWLRGPLRDWASSLLSRDHLIADGYLDADLVGRYWREHSTRRRDRSHLIWTVLMFQAWLRA